MKLLRILSRNIRDAVRNVFRNPSLSLASISCITITLIVVSLSVVLTFNVNSFTKNVENDVTIVAFMYTDITDEAKDDVLENIQVIDGIESYEYQSKTKIAEDMVESSSDLKNILSQYDEESSPLQPTYLVKVKNINNISKIAKKIEKINGVDSVKYGEGMVEKLVTIFETIKNISIGTVLALILVTAFLIINTIKITIDSRKREIQIMKLVGASNLNIKIPFIFEGLFLGILGSIIPIMATIYGYNVLYTEFGGKMFSPFIKLIEPSVIVYNISAGLLSIGILVGIFGSVTAIRKYLKI